MHPDTLELPLAHRPVLSTPEGSTMVCNSQGYGLYREEAQLLRGLVTL